MPLPLSERLRAVPPTGSMRRHYFVMRGVGVYGYGGLIDEVLDRYARRHGPIRQADAKAMRKRLAERFSSNPLGTLLAWRNEVPAIYSYPRSRNFFETFSSAFEAERESLEEGRPYISVCQFDAERKRHSEQMEKNRHREYVRVRKDDANLRECRSILKNLKEIYRETPKNYRTTA